MLAWFAAAGAVSAAASMQIAAHTTYYTVSGAGNSSANGDFYATKSGSKWLAGSGMQLFLYQGRWYIGKSGTGPVLYEGACPSATPPKDWSTYTWKGYTSSPPMPHLTASAGTPISSPTSRMSLESRTA